MKIFIRVRQLCKLFVAFSINAGVTFKRRNSAQLNRRPGPGCSKLTTSFVSYRFVKIINVNITNTMLLFFVENNMRIFSSAKDSHIFLIKIMVYLHVYQHILNELCKRFSYFSNKNNGVYAYVVSIY